MDQIAIPVSAVFTAVSMRPSRPPHGVEEELGRCQTGEIRVLYETTGLGTVIVLDEVRQCSVAEAEGNTFTLDVLLPYTGNNLE